MVAAIWLAGAPVIAPGDAVMTGFSGVVIPDANETFPQKIQTPSRTHISQYNDEIFIDTDGASLKIYTLRTDRDHLWDGSSLPNLTKLEIPAKEIGQVFGIALDDAKVPNIYVTATSFYGLHIVTPDIPYEVKVGTDTFVTNDKDTRPERHVRGIATATWMPGQFGKGGGPGTVWKIDGKTGKVSKFADLIFEGLGNSGAALGNIAFDADHRQFFVSDLDNGIIHRLSMRGEPLGLFDHGVTARGVYGLAPLYSNPFNRADIHSSNFDSTNTKTWGYAREGRRIYGLTVHKSRLYYAVYNGLSQPGEIWSVALDKKGDFTEKCRFELQLQNLNANLPITDMIVTPDGKMILSQRPLNQGSYAMQALMQPIQAQTLRYHLKVPQDGTLNRWYPDPVAYAVGDDKPFSAGVGGVAIGYGYDRNGTIDHRSCNRSVWISAEGFHDLARMQTALYGIEGQPEVLAGVTSHTRNTLKILSSLPYPVRGGMGDVKIYRKPCSCKCGEKVYADSFVGNDPTAPTGGIVGSPIYSPPSIISFPPPDPRILWPVNCWIMPWLPFCQKDDEPPKPPEDPKQCMIVKTSPPGPFEQGDGTWELPLYGIQSLNGMNIDSMRITPVSGVASIANGPIFAVGTPLPLLSGVVPGTDAVLNLCGFDSTKVVPGEPYECCNLKVKFKIQEDLNQTLEVVR